MTIEKATFTISHGDLNKLLDWSTAPFEDKYDQVYINVADDLVRTIANAGESIVAYSTFTEPYIQSTEHHESVDEDAGAQVIANVSDFQSYLDFVGGDEVTVTLVGPEDEELATKMILQGDLRAEMFVPSSDSDLAAIATGVVNLYNEDDQFVKQSDGEPMSTSFLTTADQMNKIVEVADFDDIVLDNYPVVVEDGEFKLEAEDENQRNSIRGSLFAQDVEGPDVSNVYSRGFPELFSTISGSVDVEIEDDHPISVVYDVDGATCRYSIMPAE